MNIFKPADKIYLNSIKNYGSHDIDINTTIAVFASRKKFVAIPLLALEMKRFD
jgi:hypothetical protein